MNPNLSSLIQVSAAARICFFGDHQDYLKLPVIAGTIDRKIFIKARPNNKKKYLLQLTDIEENKEIDLNQNINKVLPGDYFLSCLSLLQKKGGRFSQGYDIEITGNIPVNAGISSSSALVVAWLRFLLQVQDTSLKPTQAELGHWAYEAEVLFFDQPGGLMDQYTIAQENVLFIDTRTGNTEKLTPNMGTLILAESGIPKQTLTVLKNARVYGQEALKAVHEYDPNFDIYSAKAEDVQKYMAVVPDLYKKHWKAAVLNYNITLQAKALLSEDAPNSSSLGKLMNAHQELLENCIENTPSLMKVQMNAALKAGALGAKIIGSGGGGCMVALTTEQSKSKVINAFLAAGAKSAYEVKLITSTTE